MPDEPNARTPSTTYAWRRVKISSPPQAPRESRRRRRWIALGNKERRQLIEVRVRYRGGAEDWYEVRARGGVVRVQGSLTFGDVMERVYRGDLYELDK